MPPGRFVSGVTATLVGEVTVIGVCVPWKNSRAGKDYSGKRRKPWEDHERYLERLHSVLAHAPSARFVLMGDFNQKIEKPDKRQSGAVAHRAALLRRAIPPAVTVATTEFEHEGRKPIDHIALSGELRCASIEPISSKYGDRTLSDHAFGLAAEVSLRTGER